MAICSDIVINPVPKPAKNKAKKVKVRLAKTQYSDEFDFMIQYMDVCLNHNASYYNKNSKNYIICYSEGYVLAIRVYADYGPHIFYFPDEESAKAAIKELGENNLIKYYFRKESDEDAVHRFEKLVEFCT